MMGDFLYRDKSIRSNHSLHPTVRKLTTDFIHNFILHSYFPPFIKRPPLTYRHCGIQISYT
jgi:hypothetical protein